MSPVLCPRGSLKNLNVIAACQPHPSGERPATSRYSYIHDALVQFLLRGGTLHFVRQELHASADRSGRSETQNLLAVFNASIMPVRGAVLPTESAEALTCRFLWALWAGRKRLPP